MIKIYAEFWQKMISYALRGGWEFYIWCGFLSLLIIVGGLGYSFQVEDGFIVTNLSDQVSWGCYIANFSFLVGLAAAAVLLVIPSFIHENNSVKEVVLLGEILAFSAIVTALLFIVVDLGRPDRFLHILPFIGRLHFPGSILAWDVVVLNGYLILNLHIPGYLLFSKYRGKEPSKLYYFPFILISIVWAVSIHTVSAFLYSGLGGRPFWNSAILAPRFIVSAFACAPALLLIVFTVVNRLIEFFRVKQEVLHYLRRVMTYALLTNLFLLGCEIFEDFYTDSAHVESSRYLFFGLFGHGILRPYIWAAIAMEITAALILILYSKHQKWRLVILACALTIIGSWVEKGMGLVIPGFIPTPLGDIVEYSPSRVEFFVSLGIWAFGALLFTLMAKVVIGILSGRLRYEVPIQEN